MKEKLCPTCSGGAPSRMMNKPCDTCKEKIDAGKPTVENVKQCTWCRGTVDRYDFGFQCRDCGAMGDLFTGIMTQMQYNPETK